MITVETIDRFLADVRGQPMREGTRYAGEARVGGFVGSGASVSTVVGGRSGDFEVALWSEEGKIHHRCSCPSWRNPCKHEVAAALVLKQCLDPVGSEGGGRGGGRSGGAGMPLSEAERSAKVLEGPPGGQRGALLGGRQDPRREPEASRPTRRNERSMAEPIRGASHDPDEPRRRAIEEREVAARREKLTIRPADPPFLEVRSPSGFAYRVHLRGGPSGPHGCDCPDFEANRLHTCKHVERVRGHLRSSRSRLPREHARAAGKLRIYLHFGEIVEPRLFGASKGNGAEALRSAFGAGGVTLRPLARGEGELRAWLAGFGSRVEAEALAWLDRRLERKAVLPDRPIESLFPSLPLKPYGYQWIGAAFLATTGRALLADEMGLGKTVQAILAAAALRRAERPVECVTIVCPASLRGGWQDEIRRWLGEEVTLLEGPALARAAVIASRPRWLVTHYEQVLRDHECHQIHPPDLLIVDEAQRAKGLRTRTARVLKSIESRHVFALTGTPLENRLEEAYAIAQLIDQRLLPPLWQLDRDHFVRDDKGRRVVMYQNLDALRSRLAPAFLRRRKEDVALQLPEQLRSTVMVPMHAAVVSTYEDVVGQVARIASKKVILPADLERMQRLLVIARRCCNGPHMLGLGVDDRKVPKLQELEDALRDLCLGEGRKAVVFSEWTDMTDRIEALGGRLGLPVFHLHGGVPVRTRPDLIRAFTECKGPAVFVSTDSGGVGLNLQTADVVVNVDLPWNPARLEQRIARVHRIGSRHTVQVILLVTKESIEERILQLHDTKRNVLENIWAKKGEDSIAAPGGSGAFREMVSSLLRTKATFAAVDTGENGEPETHGRKPIEPGAEGTSAAARRSGEAAVAAEEHRTVLAIGTGTQARNASISGRQGDTRTGGRPGAPPSPAPGVLVDPAAIAAAVAAIAPTLALDHRRSLATVFSALARALEG